MPEEAKPKRGPQSGTCSLASLGSLAETEELEFPDEHWGDYKKLAAGLLHAFTDDDVVRAITNIVQSAVRAELSRSSQRFSKASNRSGILSSLGLSQSAEAYGYSSGARLSHASAGMRQQLSVQSLRTDNIDDTAKQLVGLRSPPVSARGRVEAKGSQRSQQSGLGSFGQQGPPEPMRQQLSVQSFKSAHTKATEVSLVGSSEADCCEVLCYSQELNAGFGGPTDADMLQRNLTVSINEEINEEVKGYRSETREENLGFPTESENSDNDDFAMGPPMTTLNRHPRRFDIFKELQFQKRKAKGRVSLEFGGSLSVNHIITALTNPDKNRSQRSSFAEIAKGLICGGEPCRRIKLFVTSGWIDYVSAVCILLNAVMLGVQADHMIVNITEKDPPVLRLTEVSFCVVFTVELLLRMSVYRCSFFSCRATGWQWNWFDFFVVALQLFEELMTAVTMLVHSGKSANFVSNFGMMRVLRLLRLVRIMRLLRVLHMINELRTLVVSLFTCARSLAWTLVLVFMTIYIVSIFIAQSITGAMVEDPDNPQFDVLYFHFGSLAQTLLTLYQTITGGVNWNVLVQPLNDHVSPLVTAVFLFYVSFSLLALFNIVTGVFVENALLSAKKDKDLYMLQHVCELFRKGDVNGDGVITRQEFVQLISEIEMQSLLKDIGLAPDEVLSLFEIIDVNGDGKITPDEFLNGCLRCRGDARAYEQLILAHELKLFHERSGVTTNHLTSTVAKVSSQMHSLMMQMVNLEVRCANQPGNANVLQASARQLVSTPQRIKKPAG